MAWRRSIRSVVIGVGVTLATAHLAWAQPTLTISSDLVAPGTPVTAIITGTAGHSWALVGSPVGAGLSHAGTALNVGTDVAILGIGVLDGTGQTVVNITPPFVGVVLDRYYLQAVTSPSPAFAPIAASAGRVVRNGDLLAGGTGSPGPAGPPGATGPSGATGAAGTPGATGTPGPTGPTGPTGLMGFPGTPGSPGVMGLPGTPGTNGATGLQGATGAQGPIGPTGATGATGAIGATGATGPTGAPGVATNAAGAFDLSNPHGFVGSGTVGSGNLAASGDGTRFVWHPSKSALRAGTVSGPQWDEVNIGPYSVAFGFGTTASGVSSTALSDASTASGDYSVAAGHAGYAAGTGSVAIGFVAQATGNYATALGSFTTASGHKSTALGYAASTNERDGAFVYGDTSTDDVLSASAANQFVVRAAGGFRFRTKSDLSTGCDLPADSGTFSCTSSRFTKDRVLAVDGDDLLVRLRAVPVNAWSYIGEAGDVRHIGPFAEDFRAAFGLGVNDTSIGLQDIDGVNLAAVKALDARTQRTQDDVARLMEENAALRAELAALRRMIAGLSPPGNDLRR